MRFREHRFRKSYGIIGVARKGKGAMPPKNF